MILICMQTHEVTEDRGTKAGGGEDAPDNEPAKDAVTALGTNIGALTAWAGIAACKGGDPGGDLRDLQVAGRSVCDEMANLRWRLGIRGRLLFVLLMSQVLFYKAHTGG